jgi:histidyl-tRNA synthetase
MRGLDYYNGIVFEFLNQEGLAVLGGGRYDELLSKMSSGDVSAPCTGWALGIERIEGMIQLPEDNRPIIFVCPIDESDVIESLVLADKIRCLGYGVDFYEEKNITKRLQKINSLKTNSYVIILGESERFSKKAKIKRMKDGEEKEIDLQNICFDQGFI